MSQQLAIIPVFILATITIGTSNFIKAPKNLTVPVGPQTTAPFFCQHDSADDILWKVNGSSLHQYSGSEVTACTNILPNRQRLDKLKIKARAEYNTTTVVCVAVFFNHDRTAEESDLATLTITDNARPLPTDFIETPGSLVAAIGETANFTCRHCTADEIDWRLNGTRVLNSNLPESIHIDYEFPDDQISLYCGGVYSLVIADILDYNGTEVQCEAYFSDAPNEAAVPEASLLTQGPLGQVTDLRRNSSGTFEPVVQYAWNPPYSLNVTHAEPDIAYCVRIHNITCPMQRSTTFTDNCTIFEPTFPLTNNFGMEEIFEIEVIARTNLDEAPNGTNITKYRDELVTFNSSVVGYSISVLTRKHVQVQLYVQEIESSSVLPREIEVQLNDAYQPSSSSSLSSINCLGTLMNMSYARFNLNCPMPLEVGKLFLSTVYIPTAAGCRINSSDKIELSTHLVQNIEVHYQPNGVLVSGELLNADIAYTTALGFLVIAYARNNHTSLHYGIAVPRSDLPGVMHAEVLLFISSVHDQEYRVSVFTIERNGLPFSRSASVRFAQASVGNSNMSRDIPSTNSTPNIHASYEGDPGCVRCTFLDDSASSCLVIASNKSQSSSTKGITDIDIFNFSKIDGEAYAYDCINRSASDLNVVVFAYDKELARITGSGVIVESLMEEPTTDSTAMTVSTIMIINKLESNGTFQAPFITAIVFPLISIALILSTTITICLVRGKRNRALMKIHSEENDQNKSSTECELRPNYKLKSLSRSASYRQLTLETTCGSLQNSREKVTDKA